MSNLDFAFLKYIFEVRPSFRRLLNSKRNIKVSEPMVSGIIDFMIHDLASKWTDEQVPTSETTAMMLEKARQQELADFLRTESWSNVRWQDYGESLSDFLVAYEERDYQDKYKYFKNKVYNEIEEGYQVDKTIQEFNKLLEKKKRKDVAPTPISNILDKDRLLAGEIMYPTHLADLNEALGNDPTKGGIAAGEITIVGGYTNAGKSLLAQSIWSHFLVNKIPTVFFNLEVRPDLFISNLFSQITGEWLHVDKQPQYLMPAWEKYENFIHEREDIFVLYNDDGPRNISQLEEHIETHAANGYDVFFLDTINSMLGDQSKRTDMFTEILIRLEALCKKFNIAILATAQMKQSVMFNDDKRPNLWDIGESVALQQKAGTVIGVYRSDLFGDISLGQKIGGLCDYTSLMLLKLRNRSVSPGEFVRVSYDKEYRMYVPYTGKVVALSEMTEDELENQLGLV